MDRPVYCFIDDSSWERELFHNAIELRFSKIQFICVSTYRDCQQQLEKQKLYPSLFILDLYGREGQRTGVKIPQKEQLLVQINNIPNIDAVFKGLEKFTVNKDLLVNEYLKRLFAIVNEWRNLFSIQCANLDQGSQFGINNLTNVRRDYPGVAAVMYTRKGLFTDATKLSQYDCNGIFIKPTGFTDEEIYEETKSQADTLMDKWNECIRIQYLNFVEKSRIQNETSVKLADLLLQNKRHVSNEGAKQKAKTLLDSLQTLLSDAANVSTLFVNALTLWTRFYYGLP